MAKKYEAPKIKRMNMNTGAGICEPGSGATGFCNSAGNSATSDCQFPGLSPGGDCNPVGSGE